MATTLYDPWGEGCGTFADTAFEEEQETHSRLLGPDGKPLRYEDQKQKLGFDLTARSGK